MGVLLSAIVIDVKGNGVIGGLKFSFCDGGSPPNSLSILVAHMFLLRETLEFPLYLSAIV
jgi:hypothetical protein